MAACGAMRWRRVTQGMGVPGMMPPRRPRREAILVVTTALVHVVERQRRVVPLPDGVPPARCQEHRTVPARAAALLSHATFSASAICMGNGNYRFTDGFEASPQGVAMARLHPEVQAHTAGKFAQLAIVVALCNLAQLPCDYLEVLDGV